MTVSNGAIAGMCEKADYELLGSYDGVALYGRK
jgi:hypothetical protein